MSLNQSAEAMGQAPIPKLLLGFSLPATVALMVNALYNIVDRIFIGRYVGSDGLGAITLVFPTAIFVSALSVLIGVGSASQLSRSLGRGDLQRAQETLGTSLAAVGCLSALAVPLCWPRLDSILELCGSDPSLLPLAREYLAIIFWGLIVQFFTNVLNYQARAQGHPRYAMWTMILGALANVVLDWVFIALLGWGVAGAAWGTVLAQALSFGWILAFYLRRLGTVHIRLRDLGLRAPILRETLMVGLSPFLMGLSFGLISLAFNQLFSRYGGVMALSSMGIFFSLDSICFMPVNGISEGVMPLVGYNYGAGKFQRVRQTIKLGLCCGIGYFLIAQVAALTVPELFVRAFSDDPQLIAMASRAMRLGHLAMPMATFSIVAASALQGLGKARLALGLSLIRQLFYAVPLLLLPPRLGVDGVWLSLPCVETFGGLLGIALLWSQSRLWRQGPEG